MSTQLGIPIAIGSAAGAAIAAIKFEPRVVLAPQLPDSLRAFAYVFNAERELHAAREIAPAGSGGPSV